MNWTSTCTEDYKIALEYLKSQLGIAHLDHTDRTELMPYYAQITSWLDNELYTQASDVLLEKLNLIFDLFEEGGDNICKKDSGTPIDEAVKCGVLENAQTIPSEWDQDRFDFSWTDLMSTLVLRLKLQYSYLLDQSDSDSGCCSCSSGQTTEDFESWQSGVYPTDETSDWTNSLRTGSAWKTSVTRYCDCYRTDSTDNN